MMGFLQLLDGPDERETKNWSNWLAYYVGKLTSLSEDASSLAERQMVNVRVQLSYGPFVQVGCPTLSIFLICAGNVRDFRHCQRDIQSSSFTNPHEKHWNVLLVCG